MDLAISPLGFCLLASGANGVLLPLRDDTLGGALLLRVGHCVGLVWNGRCSPLGGGGHCNRR